MNERNENLKKIKAYVAEKINTIVDNIAKELENRKSTQMYNLKSLSDLLEINDNLSNGDDKDYTLDYMELAKGLINDDDTPAPKWSKEETTTIAKDYNIEFNDISADDWYLALNMIYSDYCEVAKKYNIHIPEYYVDMTKAFLFDKDTKHGKDKLEAYFKYVK